MAIGRAADDVAAVQVWAVELKKHLAEQLRVSFGGMQH